MILKHLKKHTCSDKIDSYFKDKGEFSMNQYNQGLIVLDKDIVEQENNKIYLKQNIKKINIYPYTQSAYNILKNVFTSKKIYIVNFKYTEELTLDFNKFNSVKETYNILSKQGYSIKNDKELIEIATQKLVPRKRLIAMKQKLGMSAFKGSAIRQYEIQRIICLDTDLIYSIEKTVTDNIIKDCINQCLLN